MARPSIRNRRANQALPSPARHGPRRDVELAADRVDGQDRLGRLLGRLARRFPERSSTKEPKVVPHVLAVENQGGGRLRGTEAGDPEAEIFVVGIRALPGRSPRAVDSARSICSRSDAHAGANRPAAPSVASSARMSCTRCPSPTPRADRPIPSTTKTFLSEKTFAARPKKRSRISRVSSPIRDTAFSTPPRQRPLISNGISEAACKKIAPTDTFTLVSHADSCLKDTKFIAAVSNRTFQFLRYSEHRGDSCLHSSKIHPALKVLDGLNPPRRSPRRRNMHPCLYLHAIAT